MQCLETRPNMETLQKLVVNVLRSPFVDHNGGFALDACDLARVLLGAEPFEPVGEFVHTYERKGGTFDVYHATFDSKAAQVHNTKFRCGPRLPSGQQLALAAWSWCR